MPRATTSPAEGEEGFTLVEMVVTMMVMSLVATSVMMVAMQTFTNTATITNRRDVLADGRVALDRLGKQLRQGEVVSTSTACDATSRSSLTLSDPLSPPDKSGVEFTTYVDQVPTTVVWRATGSTAPYALQQSIGGGAPVTILSELSSNCLFFLTSHTDAEGNTVFDEVTATLGLTTSTDSVITLTEGVELRNALS